MRIESLGKKRLGVAVVALLFVLCAAATPGRDIKKTGRTTQARAPRGAASVIIIKFADETYPTIRAVDGATNQPYGVYGPRRTQGPHAWASLPAPDPSLFELEWDNAAAPQASGGGAEQAGGYNDMAGWWGSIYPWDYGANGGDQLDRPNWREDFNHGAPSTAPAVRYPRYNLMEYYAYLADWQREQGQGR